ncbi:hypothetical protein BU16DRAFT_329732 [Lophium mytilinum]|uniref:F-box domain-containing protein n=1 Tax=Lophium mytilinum TaxID=390894 RepID=A0A6A6R262_9PEZI|nr:hypothetical protein BU16DRAFT_329732 [Lophium mytilinum]
MTPRRRPQGPPKDFPDCLYQPRGEPERLKNMTISQLHNLPTELIFIVIEHLAHLEVQSFRLACSKFWHTVPHSTNMGSHEAKERFKQSLRDDKTTAKTEAKERALIASCRRERESRWTIEGLSVSTNFYCSYCRLDHLSTAFSPTELSKPPEERLCKGAEPTTRVRLCAHFTFSHAELAAAAEIYRPTLCRHPSHLYGAFWSTREPAWFHPPQIHKWVMFQHIGVLKLAQGEDLTKNTLRAALTALGRPAIFCAHMSACGEWVDTKPCAVRTWRSVFLFDVRCEQEDCWTLCRLYRWEGDVVMQVWRKLAAKCEFTLGVNGPKNIRNCEGKATEAVWLAQTSLGPRVPGGAEVEILG